MIDIYLLCVYGSVSNEMCVDMFFFKAHPIFMINQYLLT